MESELIPMSELIPIWPREAQDIRKWFNDLTYATMYQPEGRTKLEEYALRKLYLCKSQKGAQHECVIAEFQHGRDPKRIYLRVDRTIGRVNDPPDVPKAKSRMSRIFRRRETREITFNAETKVPMVKALTEPLAASSTDSFEFISHRRHALDWVIPINTMADKEHSVAAQIIFLDDHPAPNPLDLARAGTAAHTIQEVYSLLQHQCYWYADSVFAILENALPKESIHVEYRPTLSWKEMITRMEKPEKPTKGPNAGHWHDVPIPIYTRDKEAVQRYVALFRRWKDEWQSKVDDQIRDQLDSEATKVQAVKDREEKETVKREAQANGARQQEDIMAIRQELAKERKRELATSQALARAKAGELANSHALAKERAEGLARSQESTRERAEALVRNQELTRERAAKAALQEKVDELLKQLASQQT